MKSEFPSINYILNQFVDVVVVVVHKFLTRSVVVPLGHTVMHRFSPSRKY